MTPAEVHARMLAAVAGLSVMRSPTTAEANVLAAVFAAQPGIISATYNETTASIDMVIEAAPLDEIAISIAVDP